LSSSALADAEHVRRQSMAEAIAALRAAGLVTSGPDPYDARRTLIKATPEGELLAKEIPAARESWLSSAIQMLLAPGEEQTLTQAAAIMNRIADSQI
jgi:DNA-binding MarR family transcriptional regulator